MNLNSNMYSQQGRSPVGRVALIPTLTYLLKYMIVQWKFSYQFLINKKHLFCANLCRDEGNPTYSFFVMLILLNGALENGPYIDFIGGYHATS